jgi:hypothetical protein
MEASAMNASPKLRKRKRLKLTREQKKAIWAKPTANAGAGWDAKWSEPRDPIKFLREDS